MESNVRDLPVKDYFEQIKSQRLGEVLSSFKSEEKRKLEAKLDKVFNQIMDTLAEENRRLIYELEETYHAIMALDIDFAYDVGFKDGQYLMKSIYHILYEL